MLRIGVCEENRSKRAYIESMIQNSKVKCKLFLFRTKEEILKTKEEIDIWLLDIGQIEESGLTEVLEKAAKKKEEKKIVIKVGTTYHTLSVKEIYFAENNGRKIVLHRKDSSLEFYGKMEEMEQELGDGFFRCHRGYLVAFSKVAGYDAGNIYLKNGESVYLAKRKYGDFVKMYKSFLEANKEK